ncbi:MAG TPA: radical SAM protein [bacterium]|mgnify:CR=1 FL=1|nr:radical SAM protein [bacterium]
MHKEIEISKTVSLCPECDRIIDAEIIERNGRVFIRKTCPEHGDFELLLFDDASFYRRLLKTTSKVPEEFDNCDVTGCLSCRRHMPRVKTLMIDVTERCNLNCTACFTNTHARKSRDPGIEEIRERLSKWVDNKPTVLLCGGEPTVREDLEDVIRTIDSMGFVVKMASNGIRLAEADYVKRLKDAGLGWVLFQLDGFSDDIYMKTRGRKLVDIKRQALINLADAGIKVCLAFMVVRGVNDFEIGRVVDFVMNSDNIMHLGCTVLSDVGRDGFAPENITSAIHVMQSIEKETEGRVRVEDFMQTRLIGDRLFRLTGNLEFQQKTCFHMALLHKRKDGYIPVNRYARPGTALRNIGGFAELGLLYGSLKHWDAIQLSGRVKLLTIEDFRPHDTIDLVDANRCNKAYMTEEGYIPPCIYNTKYRPHCWRANDVDGARE